MQAPLLYYYSPLLVHVTKLALHFHLIARATDFETMVIPFLPPRLKILEMRYFRNPGLSGFDEPIINEGVDGSAEGVDESEAPLPALPELEELLL